MIEADIAKVAASPPVATLKQANSSEAATMLAVIERAAANPAVDLDKMERLLAMRERFVLQEAEAAFNEAMNQAQAEMSRVAADAENQQTHSSYASYGQLDRHLRPIYTKHGFSLSFDTAATDRSEYLRVSCRVARGGFSRVYHLDVPADGKGAKGGDVMTKTHATGAATAYGMRYLLKMIFNVAIGEDDTDGNVPEMRITAEQEADINALIDEVKADKGAYLRYLKIDSLAQLQASAYSYAVAALEAKRRKSK